MSRNRDTRRPAQPIQRQAAERFHPDPQVGLSQEQVRQRVHQGLHNGTGGIKTKYFKLRPSPGGDPGGLFP